LSMVHEYAYFVMNIFGKRSIPHTTVCKHTQVFDVSLLQRVYLQHGSIYYHRQYDVTITPFILFTSIVHHNSDHTKM